MTFKNFLIRWEINKNFERRRFLISKNFTETFPSTDCSFHETRNSIFGRKMSERELNDRKLRFNWIGFILKLQVTWSWFQNLLGKLKGGGGGAMMREGEFYSLTSSEKDSQCKGLCCSVCVCECGCGCGCVSVCVSLTKRQMRESEKCECVRKFLPVCSPEHEREDVWDGGTFIGAQRPRERKRAELSFCSSML